MPYSISEENYIKTIFHLQGDGRNVTTNEVADSLNTRPASVTDMLKKLKEKKLLQYERYKGFRLNAEGKKVALNVIRKHRLWEYFLVEKLTFGWDEVHEIAEELEHIKSKKLIDRLDDFLGNPRYDPHGDPIPDQSGKMHQIQLISLFNMDENVLSEVCGVGDQSSELLEILRHKQIHIGTKLEVKKKFRFDNSIEIKIRNLPAFTISELLAKSILVKKTV